MGLSFRLSECLSARTSISEYFPSSTPLSFFFSFLNVAYVVHMSLCACGWAFFIFSPMNISILRISDAVNGCFREHTSNFIEFLMHSCPFNYFIPRH